MNSGRRRGSYGLERFECVTNCCLRASKLVSAARCAMFVSANCRNHASISCGEGPTQYIDYGR